MRLQLISLAAIIVLQSAEAHAGYGSIYYDFYSAGHGDAHGYSTPECAKANARNAFRQHGNLLCKIAILPYLSLNKDAPLPRAVQATRHIISLPILGGLHHQYCRI
jgi:hypothetical protein